MRVFNARHENECIRVYRLHFSFQRSNFQSGDDSEQNIHIAILSAAFTIAALSCVNGYTALQLRDDYFTYLLVLRRNDAYTCKFIKALDDEINCLGCSEISE